MKFKSLLTSYPNLAGSSVLTVSEKFKKCYKVGYKNVKTLMLLESMRHKA